MDEEHTSTTCQYCGGGIEFPSRGFGIMTDCPHCGRKIALGIIQTKCPACNKPIHFEEHSIENIGVCPHCNSLMQHKKPPLQPPSDEQRGTNDNHPLILLVAVGFFWLLLEGLIYWSGESVGVVTHIVLAVCAAAIVGSQMKRDKPES